MHPRVKHVLAAHPAPWSLRRAAFPAPHCDVVIADGAGYLVASYAADDEPLAAGLVEAVNHAATSGPFLADVRGLVLYAPQTCQVETLAQAWTLLGESLLSLQIEIDLPPGKRSVTSARDHLVRLAAVAWLAAKQLGLESRAEAISKDTPF